MNTHVTLPRNFAGALGFFGVLAYPRPQDVDKAEEFKEALFFAYMHDVEVYTAANFYPPKGPTGKLWARLKPREYEATINRGLRHMRTGHKLMQFLLLNPKAAISSKSAKEFMFGALSKEPGNVHRELKRYLPAMALHYAIANIRMLPIFIPGIDLLDVELPAWDAKRDGKQDTECDVKRPEWTRLIDVAERFDEGANGLGLIATIAKVKAVEWEGRTGAKQVTASFEFSSGKNDKDTTPRA